MAPTIVNKRQNKQAQMVTLLLLFQPEVPPVGGHQSFPLDENSVYYHGQNQHVGQEAPRDPTASPSQSRSHRRMASAPHVPKRTVSRLTSLENNVNLNNNSKNHQSSPSRRVMTNSAAMATAPTTTSQASPAAPGKKFSKVLVRKLFWFWTKVMRTSTREFSHVDLEFFFGILLHYFH